MKQPIFLVWAKTARRSTTLAKYLDAKLILLPVERRGLFLRLPKYLTLAIRTFFILLREKPYLVLVQCPPIQILFPVYFYTIFHKSKFIIDAHTGAFIGKSWHFSIYLRWLKSFARKAIMTIIPNEGIAKYLSGWGISYFVLEDGIPNFDVPVVNGKKEKSVAVICGFGVDEPIAEIIEAAKIMPDVQFYLTGTYPYELHNQELKNLKFTGFLAEPDYIKLLKQVDLIMVLTTRLDTILCGAYEGLSLEKPMILSNTQTLRFHFPKGVIHVENTAKEIVQGIKRAYHYLPLLQAEILQLKAEKTQSWLENGQKLKELIMASAQK